jgi:imidazole glycerol phosphate synthase glutamine amidotransferase subunit
MRVAVLAAGVGNVRSVVRALERAVSGPKTIETTAAPEVVRAADVLVVPGQGAFGAFAAALAGGLGEAIVERVRAGVPYLGICLGLQILFEESDEAPGERGLGLLRGHIRRLEPGMDGPRTRPLPHVGWNRAAPLVAGPTALVQSVHYYFAHSFAAEPVDPAVVLATTEYGPAFTSAVAHENIVGVQFHPEKSQQAGLTLLERFFARARRERDEGGGIS